MALWRDTHRLLSPPMDFFWAGFRASSLDLQRAGWEIAVERSDYDMRVQILLYHRKLQAQGVSNYINYEVLENSVSAFGSGRVPIKTDLQLARDLYVPARMSVHAVDMRPLWAETSHQNLEMTSVASYFRTLQAAPPDKRIILDKLSMDEVLQLALKKQEPVQEKIRREMIKRREIEEMMKAGEMPSELKAELRLVA